MPILDAALAFALTLLVVATAVTWLVRVVQWLADRRATQFQTMLHEFCSTEIGPVVKRELDRLKVGVTDALRIEATKAAETISETGTVFVTTAAAGRVEATTEEVLEHLKRSPLGELLLRRLGNEAQAVFVEMGRRYEVVGQRFTEIFRSHARWLATAIALVLAVGINVDSINIATSYIRNENLRQGVIAQMDAITAGYEARIAALDSLDVAGMGAALDTAIQGTREQIEFLRTAGFPIGWSYFPHGLWNGEPSPAATGRNTKGGWLLWILGVLLTGVLAGLGAPFWFDAVTGIARIAQRARSRRLEPDG